MEGQAKAIVSGLIITVVGGLVLTGVEKMPTHFILELLKYLSPVIAGGIAYLVVRNIQFFRILRKEEDEEFQIWFNDKDKQVNAWLGEIDNRFRDILDEHLKRADCNLKSYRESYEKRLDKLEKRPSPQ